MGRIKNQWKQIRGNFKYEVVRTFAIWFFTKFGVSVIATLTAITSFILGHREMALLVGVPAAYWVLQVILTWVLPKKLNLKFVPHGDNSPLLCLEIQNKGDAAEITAIMRVVSRSYGGLVDTRPYVGRWTLLSYKKKWDDYRPDPTASEVAIPPGNHRILEIARQAPENGSGNDISAAYLVGSDEFLRWEFEPKLDSKLPTFRLHIEFRGEGISKSVCKLYDVGPVKACGPLGMTEVSA